jgi:hypothetical protein
MAMITITIDTPTCASGLHPTKPTSSPAQYGTSSVWLSLDQIISV